MVAAAGREVANAHIIGAADGLMLTGDVVACYVRERARTDGSGTFQTVELNMATNAKVWQVEIFDAALLDTLTGMTPRNVAGERITLPVRLDLFNGRAYWKARRIGKHDEEDA